MFPVAFFDVNASHKKHLAIVTASRHRRLHAETGSGQLLMENIYQLALFALLELEHWF